MIWKIAGLSSLVDKRTESDVEASMIDKELKYRSLSLRRGRRRVR